MKKIGLVGGMTPESTGIYYKLLIQGAREPGGDPRSRILMAINDIYGRG